MKKEAWYRPLISAYRKKKSQHLALQFSTILEDLKKRDTGNHYLL